MLFTGRESLATGMTYAPAVLRNNDVGRLLLLPPLLLCVRAAATATPKWSERARRFFVARKRCMSWQRQQRQQQPALAFAANRQHAQSNARTRLACSFPSRCWLADRPTDRHSFELVSQSSCGGIYCMSSDCVATAAAADATHLGQ